MTNGSCRRGSRRLAAWVAAYDAQGWHRSGSATDGRSARWLAAEAARVGATVGVETYAFDRVVHGGSVLQIGDRTVPGMLLFDSPIPSRSCIRGAMGPVGDDTEIGVLESTFDDELLREARRNERHRAVVVVTRGGAPGLALHNAPADEPYGRPVLQVSSRSAGILATAAAERSAGSIDVDAHRAAARLENVVAQKRPNPSDRAPICVLTPRSGWWHCAAERGGGIACWLDALDVIVGSSSRPVRFIATSGHELGYSGLRRLLAAREPDPDSIWVHLGANIGARGGILGIAGSEDGLVEEMARSLRDEGFPEERMRRLPTPVGEASELHRRGARVVSLVGTNDHFHLRSDRYPSNIDLERLSEASRGIVALVTRLAERE